MTYHLNNEDNVAQGFGLKPNIPWFWVCNSQTVSSWLEPCMVIGKNKPGVWRPEED